MYRRAAVAVAVALVLAACGGLPDIGDLAEVDEEAFEPGSNASDDAIATLVVAGDTHVWEKNDWTFCEIGGALPVWVSFQENESTASGDWVQFLQRDDGINFSAVIDGGEYTGTGSGEADEIRSNGFSYTGEMGHEGESVEVSLDVTC